MDRRVGTSASRRDRWRPDDARPEVLEEVVEWQPKEGMPPLRIILADLFES
jgi:hypothetical protein